VVLAASAVSEGMMTDETFDALTASVDPAMIVVTAVADGERAGCLVGFHTQSSIVPFRYSVWLSKANHTYRVGLRSTYFGVHFLTVGDFATAELFGTVTGDDTDKFAGLALEPGPDGVPLLRDCPHRLVGRRISVLDDGGDHVCVALEPVGTAGGGAFAPLRQSGVADLVPGHDSAERPGPPTERAGDPAR
jgi:flavin reductase (DIM6/NTAB) family NADH-FMN oxidoreductase RutF